MKLPSRPRAVITGAASGFGRAMALRLADRGARLVLSDIDEDGLAQTVELAEQAGGQARSLPCDVREAEQVEAMAVLADEAWDGTDLLVNNAGVAALGKVGEVTLDNWRWQLDINLRGAIYGCHSFVPRMKAQGSGFILNVASSAGLVCGPQMGPYNVSKAGLIALSETLCGELNGENIQVSALCPTFFRTKIHTQSRATNQELQDTTERLVTGADWSAEDIADRALDGLERGDLYIIPQADGRMMWRVKRLFGQNFQDMIAKVSGSPRLMKWFMSR